ncbi:MAG TPA: flagellar protein FlgN [Gallionella sp.]|nr:flagellar protein FlgN [Gallionella sp.]
MQNSSALLTALSAELSALQAFVTLLEREQNMLMDNQTDQLIELAEQKASDAIKLNQIAESRIGLLQQHIPLLNAKTIESWLSQNQPEALPIWQVISDRTQHALQLNQTNGELIQMKLRHNQQALTVLSNAVNKVGVYGRNGQPNFSPGSGRSLGSG